MQYEGIPISESIRDLEKVAKSVRKYLDNSSIHKEVFMAAVEKLVEDVEAFAHEFKE